MKNKMDKMYFVVFGLFSIIGPIIWCLVIYIISFTSGWHSLAKIYSTDTFPEKTKSCSAVFNYVTNYNSTLVYAETSEGLYLKTLFLFIISSSSNLSLFLKWSNFLAYSSDIFLEYSSNFFLHYWLTFTFILWASNYLNLSISLS